MPLTDEVLKEIAVLSADHTAGATLLLDRTLAILRMAADAGSLREAAAAVCRSQPSMAPIWNAAVAALAERRDPGRLERFEYRRQRATAALTRFAVPVLLPSPPRPLRLLTLSSSGAVLAVVRALR